MTGLKFKSVFEAIEKMSEEEFHNAGVAIAQTKTNNILPDLIVGSEDFNEDLKLLKDGTKLYLHPSPNNSDVQDWQPIKTIPVDRYVDVWLDIPHSQGGRRIPDVCKSSTHSSGWVGTNGNNPNYFTHWRFSPLPPLKDE